MLQIDDQGEMIGAEGGTEAAVFDQEVLAMEQMVDRDPERQDGQSRERWLEAESDL